MKKQKLQYWILIGDIAWAFVALCLACLIRYGLHWLPANQAFSIFFPSLLATVALWIVIYFPMRLDCFQRGWDFFATLSQLLLAICLLMTIILASGYVLRVFLSRLTLFYFGILLFFGFLSIRLLTHTILGSKFLAKAVRRVLIVGNGPVAREVASKIRQHPEMLCNVIGFLHSADTSFDTRVGGAVDESVTIKTLAVIELLRKQCVDEIIITLSKQGNTEVLNLASQCRSEGIGVSVVPYPYELYLSKPHLLDIGGLPLLQLSETKINGFNADLKRSLDIILTIITLPISLPIVGIGIFAFLHRKGGPFSKELRCGQFEQPFWMYRLNSDRDAKHLGLFERWLQQLSITELPQIWNVLRGEMSLVGPRPESPARVKRYSEWQRQRLRVKPGLTGLAQVCGLRQQHSSEEKARFDLQYIMNASVFFDISLMLQTAWTLLVRVVRFNKSTTDHFENSQELGLEYLFERAMPSAHSTQSSAD